MNLGDSNFKINAKNEFLAQENLGFDTKQDIFRKKFIYDLHDLKIEVKVKTDLRLQILKKCLKVMLKFVKISIDNGQIKTKNAQVLMTFDPQYDI